MNAVHVNYGLVQEGEDAVINYLGKLETSVGDIKTAVETRLMTQNSGAFADAFAEEEAKWQTQIENIRLIFDDVKRKVAEGASNINMRDQAGARSLTGS